MNLNYFSINEFDSPDLSNSGVNMDREFLQMLDLAREISGVSFRINSGYRTREHNERVGGKSDSSHLIGKAADIHCKTSRDRSIVLDSLKQAGFHRFGIAKTFIHVDNDSSKSEEVIWLY